MNTLPSGPKVTFLFTDVEGSAYGWEQHPDTMQAALIRHHQILQAAIEENGGHVFQTLGDASCAAFDNADAALVATNEALQRLHTTDWGEVGELKVRFALHTGPGEARDGQYFAPHTLNRLSRILKVTHGGQILLSAATQAALDTIPAPFSLRDMGIRQLRDLSEPEHIYQLIIPGLPADFPPLKTLDARPNNIPAQPTSMLGRQQELASVRAMLRQPHIRLVTLTGPGGSGKTRLAIELAAELIDEFADGVFFVALDTTFDPTLLTSFIAQTLGLTESSEQPIAVTLAEYLRDREMLLVLDNFEQVVAAAPIVGQLLDNAPRLRIIVSSRILLKLPAEHEFAVPPLPLPEQQDDLAAIADSPAVALFVQRAQAAKPDFALTPANATACAEICARLDGLPLAIELAAARIKLFSPTALLERLSDRLKTLTSTMRDLPERQRSLRGAIDWSYNLLSTEEKRLFRRLSIFVGNCTTAAAAAINDFSLPLDDLVVHGNADQQTTPPQLAPTNELLQSLADKSLLRVAANRRFFMLDTIREYALEKLASGDDGGTRYDIQRAVREYAVEQLIASGEEGETRARHAAYYQQLALATEPYIRGPEQTYWMSLLDRDYDNIRAALAWLLSQNDAQAGCQMAAALWWYWFSRGYLSEGRRWCSEALATIEPTAGTALQARLLRSIGWFERLQGDLDQARNSYQQALSISRALDDKIEIAKTLSNIGLISWDQQDFATALALQEESLAMFKVLGDRVGVMNSLGNLGLVAMEQNDFPLARNYFEQAIALSRELNDNWGLAASLCNLALVMTRQGDYPLAQSLTEEGLAIFNQLDAKTDSAISLGTLARLLFLQGNYAQARAIYNQTLALQMELGNKNEVVEMLEGIAELELVNGNPNRAAQLMGAAAAMREADKLAVAINSQDEYSQLIERLNTQLDPATLATQWAAGQAMSLPEIVDYAANP